MSKNKDLPQGRPVEPKLKFMLRGPFYRAFTWKERLQILIGYAARIEFVVLTEHSAGAYKPMAKLTTTADLPPPPEEGIQDAPETPKP